MCDEAPLTFEVNIAGNNSTADPNHPNTAFGEGPNTNWEGSSKVIVGPNCEYMMANAMKTAAAFTASVLAVSSLYI